MLFDNITAAFQALFVVETLALMMVGVVAGLIAGGVRFGAATGSSRVS